VPVPAEVVTLIAAGGGPGRTVSWMRVLETTLKPALLPLIRTAVAPAKFEPSTTTLVPAGPWLGEKDWIVGADWVTVKRSRWWRCRSAW
jgi:hypothetical protein